MTDILTIDARGLTCPQPVLETKKVLDQGSSDHIRVLVDSLTARENVSRFARNQGCEVSVQDKDSGESEIKITRTGTTINPPQEALLVCSQTETSASTRNVVYIATNIMGRGDDDLGAKLMRGFLRTWIDVSPLPWRIIFINSGVRLTTVDQEAVEAIAILEERGVEILSCGTCLQHFGLADNLKVGKATNMFEVIESLNSATKVISPD
jgi:selenium metabolism protein YedF